jgi:cell cycle checkpoint protein
MLQRILLLTGPAGVGKTTALKVLARALDVELIEWGDGVEEWSLGDGFSKLVA